MRIGVYGGSFNPPHIGHLIPVEWAADILRLSKVLIVPAKSPPHKDAEQLAASEHRFEMTRLAIEDNPLFELCAVEFDEGQPPYTVALLRRLGELYPDDDLILLIGADSLAELTSWHHFELLPSAYLRRPL